MNVNETNYSLNYIVIYLMLFILCTIRILSQNIVMSTMQLHVSVYVCVGDVYSF